MSRRMRRRRARDTLGAMAAKKKHSGMRPQKKLRAHEHWQVPAFGENRGLGVRGPTPIENSHPVLAAIREAVKRAREHAELLDGDYDLANILEAVGELAAFSVFTSKVRSLPPQRPSDKKRNEVAVAKLELEGEQRRRSAMNWARTVLRTDRKQKPTDLDLMGADSHHPLDRDDVILSLSKLAGRVRRRELLRGGAIQIGNVTVVPEVEAWNEASPRGLADEAYFDLLAGHHLFDVDIPDRVVFTERAVSEIERTRRRNRHDVENFVAAVLRAWGVAENDAKSAAKPIGGKRARFNR